MMESFIRGKGVEAECRIIHVAYVNVSITNLQRNIYIYIYHGVKNLLGCPCPWLYLLNC